MTQTAENEVNNASINDIGIEFGVDNGKLNSKLPIKITNKKARIIIFAGRTFSQDNNSCKCVSRLTKIKNNKICEIKKLISKEGTRMPTDTISKIRLLIGF